MKNFLNVLLRASFGLFSYTLKRNGFKRLDRSEDLEIPVVVALGNAVVGGPGSPW